MTTPEFIAVALTCVAIVFIVADFLSVALALLAAAAWLLIGSIFWSLVKEFRRDRR